MPPTDWNQNLSWMRSEDESGQFRVLWLGNPAVLPVDPVVHGDVGYGVTNDGPGDARTAPAAAGRRHERRGSARPSTCSASARSNRVGALLGPMGVRYLAVPERPDPGIERTDPAPAALLVALGEQLDLCGSRAHPGWSCTRTAPGSPARPHAARTPRSRRGAADPVGPLGRIAASPARCATGFAVRAGTILWSQTYDGAWEASSNGAHAAAPAGVRLGERVHARPPGTVSFSYANQWLRYPACCSSSRARRRWFCSGGGARGSSWPFRAADRSSEVESMSPRARPQRPPRSDPRGDPRRARLPARWPRFVDRSGSSRLEHRARQLVALGPRVPAADAVETAWYCAEGTSNPGGRADERIFIANIDHRVAARADHRHAGPDVAPKVTSIDVARGIAGHASGWRTSWRSPSPACWSR